MKTVPHKGGFSMFDPDAPFFKASEPKVPDEEDAVPHKGGFSMFKANQPQVPDEIDAAKMKFFEFKEKKTAELKQFDWGFK